MVSKPTMRHWSFCQMSRKSSRMEVLLGGASDTLFGGEEAERQHHKSDHREHRNAARKPKTLSSPPISLTSGIISTVESMPPAVASTKRRGLQ